MAISRTEVSTPEVANAAAATVSRVRSFRRASDRLRAGTVSLPAPAATPPVPSAPPDQTGTTLRPRFCQVHLHQRAELATRTGQDYYRAIAGVSRVLANLYRGSQTDALAYVDDARQAAEACGNLTALAWVRYAHGEALMDSAPRRAAALLEQAIATATLINSQLARGVALVSLASLCGRGGDTRRALELFRDAVSHWRDIGDHTHQVTTLRNLVVTGANPSFGAEADRVNTAWRQVVDRMGAERADVAAERGRRMTPPHLVDEALTHLHALLEAG